MGDERERRQSGKVLIPILFARSERVTLIPHVKVATVMKEEQYNGIMKRLLEWRRESPRASWERGKIKRPSDVPEMRTRARLDEGRCARLSLLQLRVCVRACVYARRVCACV